MFGPRRWSPARVLRFVDALPSTSRYRARQLGEAILDGDVAGRKPDLVNDELAREVHALAVGLRAAREDDALQVARALLDRMHLVARFAAGFMEGDVDLDEITTSPWDTRWPTEPGQPAVPAPRPQSTSGPASLRDVIMRFEAGRSRSTS